MSGGKVISPGYRCGSLTVMEKTEERKAGYIVWKCRCACGNTILLDTRCLQRGTVRDCGCITKVRPGTKDLTGQRFGRLLCLEQTEQRKDRRAVWRCRCDCGREVLVPTGQLTNGYTKSCGCLGRPPLKDHIGKRFGRLTVTAYAGKRSGIHRWECRCDCGGTAIVGQTALQSGHTRSCGCLQDKMRRDNLKLIDGTSVTLLEATDKRLLKSNTSGYNGVYYNRRSGKWAAQITFKKKTYYLGSYLEITEAVKARHRAEEMYDEFLEWYHRSVKTDDPAG